MFLYSLSWSKQNTSLFTLIQFHCNITETSNILIWFTMATLDLTSETECEDPQIAGISVPMESGTNSDE